MSGGRAIPMLLAVALLLLNAGDCVSPIFADQQSRDCCARGQCHSSQKKDPCCQTAPPTVTKDFQLAAKVTLDHRPIVLTDAVAANSAFSPSPAAVWRDCLDLTVQWPPGIVAGVSLPLLV